MVTKQAMASGKENYLLVDLENISKVNLTNLNGIAKVLIFVGSSQSKIDFDLVYTTHSLEKKVQWIKIKGNGKNALDFHITFYLGQISSENKKAKFFLLSGDKGYDPLIAHLHQLKIGCQRIASVLEIETQSQSSGSSIDEVIRHLSTIEKSNRPRKRKTLEAFISASFKTLGKPEIEQAINQIFELKLAQVDIKGNVSYLT